MEREWGKGGSDSPPVPAGLLDVGFQKGWRHEFYLRRFEKDCVRQGCTVIREFGDLEGLQFGAGPSQLSDDL